MAVPLLHSSQAPHWLDSSVLTLLSWRTVCKELTTGKWEKGGDRDARVQVLWWALPWLYLIIAMQWQLCNDNNTKLQTDLSNIGFYLFSFILRLSCLILHHIYWQDLSNQWFRQTFSRQTTHHQALLEFGVFGCTLLICKKVNYKPNQIQKCPINCINTAAGSRVFYFAYSYDYSSKGQIHSRQHHCPLIPDDKRLSHFILAPF